MTDPSYIHVFGGRIDTIKLLSTKHQTDPTTIRVDLNDNYMLCLKPDTANQLLALLAGRLYDDGTMTRDTADRVNHLTNVVLMDPSEHAEIVAMHSGEDY